MDIIQAIWGLSRVDNVEERQICVLSLSWVITLSCSQMSMPLILGPSDVNWDLHQLLSPLPPCPPHSLPNSDLQTGTESHHQLAFLVLQILGLLGIHNHLSQFL